LGLVEWRKTYFNNGAPAEQIHLRLNQAEANTFPPIPQPGPGYTVLAAINAGPDCANLLPLALDAGTLTVQVPGGQINQATPLPPGGETTNSLPAGTVVAGTHSVTTLGGKEVGPFSSTVTLPPPIQVTSQFPPGSTISCSSPLTINWTGTGDQSLVDIRLRAFSGGFEHYLEAILPGSAGTFTFNPPQTGFPPMTLPFPIGCNVPAEIDVTQMPTATTVATFSANGLTLGGRSTWKYQFQFLGMQLTGAQ
jgi:hypothetical protein